MADGTQIKITALDATTAAFRSVQNNINGLQSSLRSMAGPLAAAFSVGAVGLFSKKVLDAADDMAKLSQKVGVSVTEISRLTNAAELAGVSQETLGSSLARLNKSISEAIGGAGEQRRAFESLGISVNDLKSLKPEEIFYKVSDAFAGAEDGAAKTSLAMSLLGRSGADLIPLFNQGSAELKKYSATFNEDFAKAAEQFNDNLTKIKQSFEGIAVSIGNSVLPAINKFFDVLSSISRTAKEEKRGFWSTLLGLTEIGEFLGYGIGDKVVADIKKIEQAQKEAAKPQPKTVLQSAKVDMAPIDELVERNKALVDIYKKTRQPVDVLSDGLAELNNYYEKGWISLDQYLDAQMQLQEAFQNTQPKIKLNDTALKEYSASIKNVRDSLQDVAVRGLRTLEDALVGVYSGTLTVKEAFKSMAVSIIQDLIRIQVQRSITGPIADALSGLFSAQNTGQAYMGGISPRALGGSVMSNEAYMVGEKGPELFVPGKTGSIVPNNALGGSGATINQTINISTGVSQTVRAEVMNMLPRIMEATKAAVADSKLRGGTYGKMLA